MRSALAVRRYPEVVDACTVTGRLIRPGAYQGGRVRHFEDGVIGQTYPRWSLFVVRTRSVIVLSRLVHRADALAPLR